MENNIREQLQDAIDEMLIYLDDCKDTMEKDKKSKYMIAYIMGVMSYVNGTKILWDNGQYDSILILCRAFLEGYGVISDLLDKYSNSTEYEEYLKILIVEDMVQDKKIFNSIKKDITIIDESIRRRDLDSFLIRWENNLKTFFPIEVTNIDEADKENGLIHMINQLASNYQHAISKADQIGRALENNKAYFSDLGVVCESSYVIYRLLCSEAHVNIGSVDARTTTNGLFSINLNNEGNARASVQIMIYCLKDMADRLGRYFKER